MQENDVAASDRLEAAFGIKDSEATLNVPIAKSSQDNSIDIMPSPKKKAGHSQSPTPSVSVYFPGRIASNVFSDLALSVKHRFQQQLKRFAPEDDTVNIRQKAEKIHEVDYLELKNTVETYLTKTGGNLKLKAQLEDRTPTAEV